MCGELLSRRHSHGIANSEAKQSHFWQCRFYNFSVRNHEKVREKLDYMYVNPVKRKLVEHPKQWPWSNWSHYEKGEQGPMAIDSAEQK